MPARPVNQACVAEAGAQRNVQARTYEFCESVHQGSRCCREPGHAGRVHVSTRNGGAEVTHKWTGHRTSSRAISL